MAQRSEKSSDVSKRIRAKAEKAKATQIETIEELAKQGGKPSILTPQSYSRRYLGGLHVRQSK
jgi:hypothetical protein